MGSGILLEITVGKLDLMDHLEKQEVLFEGDSEVLQCPVKTSLKHFKLKLEWSFMVRIINSCW